MTSELLPSHPRLRSVEAFPMGVPGEHGNRRLMCLRDPSLLSPHIVALQPPALFIVGLLDGVHSLQDIQERFLVRYGTILPEADLAALIARLDDSLMLDSPRFATHRASVEKAWHEAPERPCKHADGGYGGDTENLRERLEGYFTSEHGPGSPEGSALPAGCQLRALILPHIDYGRGGPTYAWAWRELLRATDIETILFLGTSHSPLSQPISVCRKPFATPHGSIEPDLELIAALEDTWGSSLESDPLVHASEHSIELQAVWLKALLKDRNVRIVPLLCGGLSLRPSSPPPWEDSAVQGFVNALRHVVPRHTRRTLLVAAADLSHIGTGFGDPQAPDAATLDQVASADLKRLDHACARDGRALYAQVREEEDCHRVCGLSPIYLLVESLGPCQSQLLAYRQCVDPQGFRTVTIASAAFFTSASPANQEGLHELR